jgi:hypothetical protein
MLQSYLVGKGVGRQPVIGCARACAIPSLCLRFRSEGAYESYVIFAILKQTASHPSQKVPSLKAASH